jgi:hypothetical protein
MSTTSPDVPITSIVPPVPSVFFFLSLLLLLPVIASHPLNAINKTSATAPIHHFFMVVSRVSFLAG